MAHKDESAMKSAFVKEVKRDGHYARRIEDQYGVGLLDIVIVTKGDGATFIEGKLVRSGSIVCTPRQRLEAQRIVAAGGRAVALGYDRGHDRYFLARVDDKPIRTGACVERRPGEPFVEFIRRYYSEE